MRQKTGWLLAAAMTIDTYGCATVGADTKVRVDQTPEAVRKTVERELVGAELEDIARKQWHGQAAYETDVIRNGQKWEVVIGEDGRILAKRMEGSAEEQAANTNDRSERSAAGWRDGFDVNKADLLPTGNNPYLTIQPGRILRLRNGIDTLTVTILPDTQEVDGVVTGILEERETKGGKLVEISRNLFATDKQTGDVYYFGEDVDNYKDGTIVNHESAWHAGEQGARFGLMIPARPTVGQNFYQELAPAIAMDRVEVVSTNETVKTPAGTFKHCVHLRETTPLDGDVSHKYYAPGVGLIKDDAFELSERP